MFILLMYAELLEEPRIDGEHVMFWFSFCLELPSSVSLLDERNFANTLSCHYAFREIGASH